MSADDPLIGWSSATLRFDALLGRGAMGAVYRGVQLGLERPVAIKVIAPHLIGDGALRVRFTREAQMLGRLVHQNVITCHDVGTQRGPDGRELFVMVLEFVDGWSLGTLMRRRPPTVRQALELHAQAADGLAAAHQLGIIHRDIKPDNIMVTRRGFQAKLADFGLAKGDDSALLTHTGAIMGSPAYMAPEACRGDAPGPSGDLYGLGCSLFHVLTGTPPYSGGSALVVLNMHMTAPFPLPSERRGDLAGLDKMMARCLGKVPAERAPDAATLAKWLRAAAKGIPEDLPSGKLPDSVAAARPSRIAERQAGNLLSAPPTELETGTAAVRAGRRIRVILAGLAATVLICAAVLFARGAGPHGTTATGEPLGGPAAAATVGGGLATAPPLRTPPPASPVGAGRVLELLPRAGLLDAWQAPAGYPLIPARVPAGVPAILLSTPDGAGVQRLRLHLATAGGRTGAVVVLSAGIATGRTLAVSALTGGVVRALPPVVLSDDAWRRIVIDCGEAGGDEVVLSDSRSQRLAVARALAWSGAPPEAATTAFTPGTLQPLVSVDGELRADFAKALSRVVVAHQRFPDPRRVRVAVSNLALAANHDALLAMVRGIANAWGADPATATTDANLLRYLSPAKLQSVAEEAVRAKTQVLVIVVGTERAPILLPLGFQLVCRELIDGGVLPVLMLAPAGWQGALRTEWVAQLAVIQGKLPQLPVIDLMEVPIGLARQGLPADPHTAAGQEQVGAGMAAGIAELRARIAWLVEAGGVRGK